MAIAIGCESSSEQKTTPAAPSASSTAVSLGAPAAVSPAPTAIIESQHLPPRTPIPGADEGGTFADGSTSLRAVDTSQWKTYSNAVYGYSFRYPPDWDLQEVDNSGQSYRDLPAYPRQFITVKNPVSERGENIPGVNCTGSGCVGSPPGALSFAVSIVEAHCNTPGDLLVLDTMMIDGREGDRCVVGAVGNAESRAAIIAFSIEEGEEDLISIGLQRGREVSLESQAELEAILASFKFASVTQ